MPPEQRAVYLTRWIVGHPEAIQTESHANSLPNLSTGLAHFPTKDVTIRSFLANALKKFYRVPRWIVKQDFGSTGPRNDIVAEV